MDSDFTNRSVKYMASFLVTNSRACVSVDTGTGYIECDAIPSSTPLIAMLQNIYITVGMALTGQRDAHTTLRAYNIPHGRFSTTLSSTLADKTDVRTRDIMKGLYTNSASDATLFNVLLISMKSKYELRTNYSAFRDHMDKLATKTQGIFEAAWLKFMYDDWNTQLDVRMLEEPSAIAQFSRDFSSLAAREIMCTMIEAVMKDDDAVAGMKLYDQYFRDTNETEDALSSGDIAAIVLGVIFVMVVLGGFISWLKSRPDNAE